MFRMMHPLLPGQSEKSWRLFHHAYIIIRTDENELWSLEKNQQGIFVERETETKAKYCPKHLNGKKRSCLYTINWSTSCVFGSFSVQDILNWIINTGELCKRYDLLEGSCQHFAARIKDAIFF
jgi:hypothetical protein